MRSDDYIIYERYLNHLSIESDDKSDKKEYTVWDNYSRDDCFTGSKEECEAWLAKMHKLYPKAKKRWFIENQEVN